MIWNLYLDIVLNFIILSGRFFNNQLLFLYAFSEPLKLSVKSEKRKDFSYEVLENFNLNILKEKIKDCDAIALKVFKLNKELLESTLKLKVISKHGVGYDNIDLDTVKNKKITLTITKNANSVSVAEHIFSMILNISKGINAYDKCVKDGNFSKKHELLPTQEISDKKILIVGFGSVTKKLIKRCLGFEMKVYIYDPNANKKLIVMPSISC